MLKGIDPDANVSLLTLPFVVDSLNFSRTTSFGDVCNEDDAECGHSFLQSTIDFNEDVQEGSILFDFKKFDAFSKRMN